MKTCDWEISKASKYTSNSKKIPCPQMCLEKTTFLVVKIIIFSQNKPFLEVDKVKKY